MNEQTHKQKHTIFVRKKMHQKANTRQSKKIAATVEKSFKQKHTELLN